MNDEQEWRLRSMLAALSRRLPRARWSVFLVKPETLLGWHRRGALAVDLRDRVHGATAGPLTSSIRRVLQAHGISPAHQRRTRVRS